MFHHHATNTSREIHTIAPFLDPVSLLVLDDGLDLHSDQLSGVLVGGETSLDSLNQSGLSGGRGGQNGRRHANQWLQRENNKELRKIQKEDE